MTIIYANINTIIAWPWWCLHGRQDNSVSRIATRFKQTSKKRALPQWTSAKPSRDATRQTSKQSASVAGKWYMDYQIAEIPMTLSDLQGLPPISTDIARLAVPPRKRSHLFSQQEVALMVAKRHATIDSHFGPFQWLGATDDRDK